MDFHQSNTSEELTKLYKMKVMSDEEFIERCLRELKLKEEELEKEKELKEEALKEVQLLKQKTEMTGGEQNVDKLIEDPERFKNPAELVEAFKSPDARDHLQAAKYIGSLKEPPSFEDIGPCIPHLIKCLNDNDNQDILMEAVNAVSVLSGCDIQFTRSLVDNGAVDPLIRMLGSPSWKISDNAVFSLGNIAGENDEFRDKLLDRGVFPEVVKMIEILLDQPFPPSALQNATWALSNLYRPHISYPKLELVSPALPLLKRLLSNPDEEVVSNAVWCVSFLVETKQSHKKTHLEASINAVVEAGFLPEIKKCLSSSCEKIIAPSVRFFGSIASLDSHYTGLVLSVDVIPSFVDFLKHKDRVDRVILKEVLWTLSNIAADDTQHTQVLIDAGAIRAAYDFLSDKGKDVALRTEAGWVVSNAALCSSIEQQKVMVEEHMLLDSLVLAVDLPNASLKKAAHETLFAVLEKLDEIPSSCVERLKKLKEDGQNQKVCKAIEAVLEKASSL